MSAPNRPRCLSSNSQASTKLYCFASFSTRSALRTTTRVSRSQLTRKVNGTKARLAKRRLLRRAESTGAVGGSRNDWRKARSRGKNIVEARVGIEPTIWDLQSRALPLCYPASGKWVGNIPACWRASSRNPLPQEANKMAKLGIFLCFSLA